MKRCAAEREIARVTYRQGALVIFFFHRRVLGKEKQEVTVRRSSTALFPIPQTLENISRVNVQRPSILFLIFNHEH